MSSFEERYQNLNKEQRDAVDALEGPVMVIAGPGTGKTELLGLRVANILRKNPDVAPANILCLTFTDAAAWNVRERLAGLIGRDAYRVAIHTFHSFGVEIINRNPEHFYHGADFLPADDITQIEILESIFEELDHGNPLRSEHNDQFTYLHKVKRAIGHLKEAGLMPAEFDEIIDQNKKAFERIDSLIQPVFGERISKKLIAPARALVEEVQAMKSVSLPGDFDSFPHAFAKALTEALDTIEEHGTAPLTAWKKRWTAKGDDGLTHLADLLNQEKIETVALAYREYVARMHAAGYYDYNDMILDAIAALAKQRGLRTQLAEQYQYILIDEFQDTNNAQMRLVQLLTETSGGRAANIMVVGDDDQAIFKFQGAELSNILNFQKRYANPKLIVLTSNYRSTQNILDLARNVIRKGDVRLEKLLPNLKKDLIAAKSGIAPGSIVGKSFLSRDLEYQWIAKEVARLQEGGTKLREIAVIAREHRDLEAAVPYFHAAKIPLCYEREENVLRVPEIMELVTMARFVNTVMRTSEEADELLPEILSYRFWGLDRATVWDVAVRSRKERKPWLRIMLEYGGRLREIAEFLLDLGGKATSATAEEILHELIGGPRILAPQEESDEEVLPAHEMFSPFRSYYFGKDRFDGDRAEYLRFLSALRSFVRALRDYHPGKPITTAQMVEFVDVHEKNRIAVNNVSSFANGENAVQFMSAHKAKGLEFEAVFVLNCEEDVWADDGRGVSVPLPTNLPLGPSGDTQDDQLRLFYVALTRAKRLLYLLAASMNDRGKKADGLSFLVADEDAPAFFAVEPVASEGFDETPEELLLSQWDAWRHRPFVAEEKALLTPVLEHYQLSITHLQNFLDVADAGPIAFLERNLLRFPEPVTPASAFGSAVHATLNGISIYQKTEKKLPNEKEILAWFKEFLGNQRLNKDDFARMLKRGEKALPIFYEAKQDLFFETNITECDFADQGVVLGSAHLTGKVDSMSISNHEIVVYDFKTGKAISGWEPGDPYEKIKAWKYRDQLAFYKLLIENSRQFAKKYTVPRGVIQFVEPFHGRIAELDMPIEAPEVKRLEALIAVVYKKIQALEFPDISKYPKNLEGIRAFEEDLLAG